jgi:hypothetical protein
LVTGAGDPLGWLLDDGLGPTGCGWVALPVLWCPGVEPLVGAGGRLVGGSDVGRAPGAELGAAADVAVLPVPGRGDGFVVGCSA